MRSKNLYLKLIDRFIAADIADFHAKRFVGADDGGIPEILGLFAITYDVAKAIDLDFGIALPCSIFVGIGAV